MTVPTGGAMRLGLISNENLPRNINWSMLSDPLYNAFEELAPCTRLAPPPLTLGSLPEQWRTLRRARLVDAVFSMNGRVWPERALMASQLAATGTLRCVFYVDPWPHLIDRIRFADRMLRHDLAFIPYRETFERLRAGEGGDRYRYLPFAADTRAFRDYGLERDIDILWMGRRDDALHGALLRLSERKGLVYRYRENMGFIDNPQELGRMAARAKYFVVTPPDRDRSGGISPLVMRYLEGLAAGCRLLGTLPQSGEYEAILPQNSILDVRPDGSDLMEKYDADQEDAGAWTSSAQASTIVNRSHGWDSRARTILAEIKALRT